MEAFDANDFYLFWRHCWCVNAVDWLYRERHRQLLCRHWLIVRFDFVVLLTKDQLLCWAFDVADDCADTLDCSRLSVFLRLRPQLLFADFYSASLDYHDSPQSSNERVKPTPILDCVETFLIHVDWVETFWIHVHYVETYEICMRVSAFGGCSRLWLCSASKAFPASIPSKSSMVLSSTTLGHLYDLYLFAFKQEVYRHLGARVLLDDGYSDSPNTTMFYSDAEILTPTIRRWMEPVALSLNYNLCTRLKALLLSPLRLYQWGRAIDARRILLNCLSDLVKDNDGHLAAVRRSEAKI